MIEMRITSVLFLLIFIVSSAFGQRLMERSGKVTFYSEAPVENISATNDQVLAVIDVSTGEIAVSMLMKGFQFRKALMQEHFNESYIESDKFPKATFTGRILDYSPAILDKSGSAIVEGDLEIHGVKQSLSTEVRIKPGENGLQVEAGFPVRVADHAIEIPSVVTNNIAEVVDIKVFLQLK